MNTSSLESISTNTKNYHTHTKSSGALFPFCLCRNKAQELRNLIKYIGDNWGNQNLRPNRSDCFFHLMLSIDYFSTMVRNMRRNKLLHINEDADF